jgi:hypothetical protein
MRPPLSLLPATFILLMAPAGVRAQQGHALLLDGNGDYMSVADHSDLDIDAGESLSLTCWVKGNASTDFHRVACKRNGPAATDAGYELITGTGTGAFGINLRSSSGANAGPPFGTTGVTDGAWHHLAMVVDAAAGNAKTYVDGVLQQTATSAAIGTESFANGADLYIGSSAAPDQFWSGWVDEVHTWSIALTQAQVQADATATLTGTEPGLLAAWNFEGVAAGSVPELTGQHAGSLHGNAQSLDPASATMTLAGIATYQPSSPTGLGETDERLVSVNFQAVGSGAPITLGELRFELDPQADASAMPTYRLYANGSAARLDLATAQLLGEAQAVGDEVQFAVSTELAEGDNVYWLCADIAADAAEGALVGAYLEQFTWNGTDSTLAAPVPAVQRTVLLAHKLLFSGGDFGCGFYRIPAIAASGNHLVAVADARFEDNGDLPGNIDLFSRYSLDGGATWSSAITVADFGSNGASDPALVLDRNSGDLLCLFASHNGLFTSTPANKIRFNVVRSPDMGLTWGTPQEFSDQIYLPGWYAAWVASGSAHQTASGRIVAAIGARKTSASTISNFMIYSDDGGLSWQTAPGQASPTGDEAKIVELDDARLLMAIRNPGQRKMTWSSDSGQSWTTPMLEPELVEPGVNGDLVRYTSVNNGYDMSRLLFSIANDPSVRRNLTVFVSYDEGDSWGTSRVVCPGAAAYSALSILGDGSIAMFYENGEYENYQLYFARFSLDWLSDGTDTFTPASPIAIGEATLPDPEFTASLDPAAQAVLVRFRAKAGERCTLDVLDSSGRVVEVLLDAAERTGEQQLTWKIRGHAKGSYVLRLRSGGRSLARPIMLP